MLGGKPAQWQELTCYAGHLPTLMGTFEKEKVRFHWIKEPIPLALWREILAFLKWSYDEHKCEAQVRLSYNAELDEWRYVAMPQYIYTGLFTKEIEPHDDREAALTEAGIYEGFSFVGTVHHHCAAGAFQSSTDHKDELTQPGYHVTVGHLNKGTADFHSRASFRGVMYEKVIDKEWLPYTEEQVRKLDNLPEVSETLKGRLEKKPVPATVTYGYHADWSKYGKQQGGKGKYRGKTPQNGRYGKVALTKYKGMGSGMPDYLPERAAKNVKQPLWIKMREYFWDYVFIVHGFLDEYSMADTKKGGSIENGVRWNQICDEASVYTNFLDSVDGYSQRTRAHDLFMAMFSRDTIRINPISLNWSFDTGRIFDPFLLLNKLEDGRGIGEANTPAIAETVAEAEEVEVDESPPETVNEVVEMGTQEVFDLMTSEEMLDAFADAPEGAIVPPILEQMFMEPGFRDWLLEHFDVALDDPSQDSLFNFEGTVSFPSERFTDATEALSAIILKTLKAVSITRFYMEKEVATIVKDSFEIGAEDLDMLLAHVSAFMNVLTLIEVQDVAEDSKSQKPTLEWLSRHIQGVLLHRANGG